MHVARFAVAAVMLAASTEHALASYVTLNFDGAYRVDRGDLSSIGLSGTSAPFHYSLTYDTSLNTDSRVYLAGSPYGAGVLLNDFYAYSASGIVSANFVLGDLTWTLTDLRQAGFIPPPNSIDLFFDTDISITVPTRSSISFGSSSFGSAVPSLFVGIAAGNSTGTQLERVSIIDQYHGLLLVSTDFQISAGQSTVTPEPTSLALAGFAGFGIAVGAWRRRRTSRQTAG